MDHPRQGWGKILTIEQVVELFAVPVQLARLFLLSLNHNFARIIL